MDTLSSLQGLGLSLPSPAYLLGMLLFSVLGMGAYRQGRRKGNDRTQWLGVALMVFSYAVSDTAWLYGVGGALTVALLWPWWQRH